MRRLTISIDEAMADTFDHLVHEKGYQNRSEAFRDLLRSELDRKRLELGDAKHCVGVLSYLFNHHERELATRLTRMQHEHHELSIATMHAHLDHDFCIETMIVRGPTASVLSFAQSLIAEKGVRHGEFRPIPVSARHTPVHREDHLHMSPYV